MLVGLSQYKTKPVHASVQPVVHNQTIVGLIIHINLF